MTQYNRDFKTISNSSTIAQWVDAYNNNALAGSDLVFMMGEATFSSVLYTGIETVGNGINVYPIEAFRDVAPDFNAVFPDNLVLDNWYVYFRNINKFILISQLHVDLTDYSKYDNDEFVQGDLYHFFLNYQLGYRISHSPIPKEGEARLFRFIATQSNISQFIPTFPRYFYAGDNVTYSKVTGMDVKPANAIALGVNDGWVDYDGITFDHHPEPDRKHYEEQHSYGYSITNPGYGYLIDDVIGTNDNTQHLRVTEVRHEYSAEDLWRSNVSYTAGELVYWDYYFWIARNNNQNSQPSVSNNNWERGDLAGVISAGELTTDPIHIQSGGRNATVEVGEVIAPWKLLYNTEDNKLDYSREVQAVDGSKILDYTTNRLRDVPAGKYTIQRVHLDYLKDLLVVQYGNRTFDTMRDALDAVYSLSFPFVYGTYIFPVLAYMIIRSDYNNIMDEEQCQIIQIHTNSTDIRDSENLATDSYARSMIAQQARQIQLLNDWLTALQGQFDDLKNKFNLHIANDLPSPASIKSGSNQNPHRVTKAEIGLGNVDNIAVKDMTVPSTGGTTGLVHVRTAIDQALAAAKSYTDSSASNVLNTAGQRFLYKDRDDATASGVITVIDDLRTRGKCIKFQANGYNTNSGYNWYVGELPANPPTESYGVMKTS